MPPRLADPKEVLRILRAHVGRDRAISAKYIAWQLGHRNGAYADRPVRATIRELRRKGHLVLSVTREPAGYFLAADAEEWHRYGQPMRGRATDLLRTVSEMEISAQAQFGATDAPSKQMELRLT